MISVASMSSPALPEELWLEILLLVPLQALRTTVCRLNSSFRAMLALRPLAELNFRGRLSTRQPARLPADGRSAPDVHPLLRHMSWRTGRFPSDDLTIAVPSGRTAALHRLAVRHDRATAPPVSKLEVSVRGAEGYLAARTVTDPFGVTVGRVLEALALILSAEVPAYECDSCGDTHFLTPGEVGWDDVEQVPYDVVRYGDALWLSPSDVECWLKGTNVRLEVAFQYDRARNARSCEHRQALPPISLSTTLTAWPDGCSSSIVEASTSGTNSIRRVARPLASLPLSRCTDPV